MHRYGVKAWLGPILLTLGYSGCKGAGGDGGGMAGDSHSGGQTMGAQSSSGGKIEIGTTSGGSSPSPSSGGGAAAEGWLQVCELPGGPSVGDPNKSLTIDDLDDGTPEFLGNGLTGVWYGYDDGTAGTRTPKAEVLPATQGGPTGSGLAMHVQGGGFTKWGSGLGLILASRGLGQECVFDASAYKGLTFWAKGLIASDGSATPWRPGTLRLKVFEKDVIPETSGGSCPKEAAAEDRCYDGHGVSLELSDCWQRYSISFDDLATEGWGYSGGELDLDELYSIEFYVEQGQSYDLWFDDLAFFTTEKPFGEPVCEGMGGAGGMGGGAP